MVDLCCRLGFLYLGEAAGSLWLWCAGFSMQWLLWLRSTDSRRLDFTSCGAWPWQFHRMWDLPALGIEPVSFTLQGGFLTTGPPGKPSRFILNMFSFCEDKMRIYYFLKLFAFIKFFALIFFIF